MPQTCRTLWTEGIQEGSAKAMHPRDEYYFKYVFRWCHIRWFGTVVALTGGALVVQKTLCQDEQDGTGSHDSGMKVSAMLKLPGRLGRDIYCAGGILADYLWSLQGLQPGTIAYQEVLEVCHARGAQRLLNLCFSNGGIYIKLGQHIAMLDHLLPDVYVKTMRNNLLDKCPVSSWHAVSRTIQEDFGYTWDEMFSDMEPIPVASASLAQVHVANIKDTGEKVAVKVQHEDLRETSFVDLMAIEGLVRFVRFVAPNADFMWLVTEANENLPRELDFRIEAENALKCKEMIESSRALKSRVDVPRIDLTRTSARVLTMEWIDGVSIADSMGLYDLKCRPKSLAQVIATCFSEMIFRFGNVHADPHVANMLVRKTDSGSWQLVLLDHGLYRRLNNDFRIEYSKLWKALILGDIQGITESAKNMNAADSVPLFAGMLTQRQWKDVTKWEKGTKRLGHQRTEQEKEEIQEFVGQHAQEIGSLLGKLPRELLLLLKTNDCLRSVDKELGAGYNTFMVTARACVHALNADRQAKHPGIRSRVRSIIERAKLEGRLQAMQAYSFLYAY